MLWCSTLGVPLAGSGPASFRDVARRVVLSRYPPGAAGTSPKWRILESRQMFFPTTWWTRDQSWPVPVRDMLAESERVNTIYVIEVSLTGRSYNRLFRASITI